MPFEIDFLPVGENSKSGDAIAFRYYTGVDAPQIVVTIDGGTRESGYALAEHVTRFYKTDTVDIAILTHPDMDHASGMRCILEELKVKQVVMHQPWNHSQAIKRLIDDDRTSHASLSNRAEKNLVAAKEVEEMALAKGASIVEPFAGAHNDFMTVLGPSVEFYQERLANFRFMPGTTKVASFTGMFETRSSPKTEAESWFRELLKEPQESASSAENNSSVVLLFRMEGQKVLFTGDAGTPALGEAMRFAQAHSISLEGINLLQVPHHGSRKNLSAGILNQLIGPVRHDASLISSAVISAAANGAPKHPNKKITNALRRRGVQVACTANGAFWYHHGTPSRASYGPVVQVPFFDVVDSDEVTE